MEIPVARPGWTALTAEARDREGRRFDAVVIYSTSRLARDRLHAALFERELRKVGVPIHYAVGAGDPSTPEGSLMIGMQQLWDEFERNRLSRETKRGMREASEQGYRAGGRAPYGYRRNLHELPEGHRGDRAKRRVTLEPEPNEALVVAEIFELFVVAKRTPKAIAEHLNRPGGPPSPSHSTPPATCAATGRRRRSARCSETPSTPAAWSGTGSTSPRPSTPAAVRGGEHARSG